MTRLSLAALALGLAAALPAAVRAADPNPADVEPGTYALEPVHTQVGFAVLHMGFTSYYGRFANASGTLVLDTKAPTASKLDVTVPTATISTTSDKLDGELKSEDWFDVAKYPQLTFRSTTITPVGKDSAKVSGDLTMHGVTKPITLDVRFVGAGTNPLDKHYTVGFQATGQISRSAFGVSKYVPLIGDDVEISLSGAFEKQG